jgi:hypothetical protein
MTMRLILTVFVAYCGLGVVQGQSLQRLGADVAAQESSTICGVTVQTPSALPPVNTGPVVYMIAPCFERQGGITTIPPTDMLRAIRLRPSQPSQGAWVPYDAVAEREIFEDFQRLRANYALAEISVDVRDFRFSNGVVGKLVTYNMVERARVVR